MTDMEHIMTRPIACEFCGLVFADAAPGHRLGAHWVCAACAPGPGGPCAEGAHEWGGAVDTQGSAVWGCRMPGCGAVLGHQALSEGVVEAAPEHGYIDC